MSQKPPVTNVIARALSWQPSRSDTSKYQALYTHTNGHRTSTTFSKEELDAYDPRVAVALTFMFERCVPSSIPHNLLYTLQHWSKPYLECNLELDGDMLRHLGGIEKLSCSVRPQHVRAHVWSFEMIKVHDFEIVLVQGLRFLNIPDHWMEQHYPGSLHRMLVAQSLGLPEEEVADAACTVPNAEPEQTNLPDNISSGLAT